MLSLDGYNMHDPVSEYVALIFIFFTEIASVCRGFLSSSVSKWPR